MTWIHVAARLGFFAVFVFAFGAAVFAAALGITATAGDLALFFAFAAGFSLATASAGAALAACFIGFFAPKRPRRTGAAAMSSLHSSSVRLFGSRSFGIFAFFTRSVMYGPKRPFNT